jgi:exodeoxyribonuclease-5
MPITFTDEQHGQIQLLTDALQRGERELVLTGPAGSGKTTCVQEFKRRAEALGWRCVFVAPTGKAALRLKEVTGEDTSTIHAVLFKSVTENQDGEPVFLDPKPPVGGRTVLIVDEASMVDFDLHQQLIRQLPDSSAILYVGDREQLPPVMGTWGPDFQAPTAVLTEVHRQALDNPIIAISADIRNGGRLPKNSTGDTYQRMSRTLDRVATWVAGEQDEGRDVILLCWTNKTRQRLNRLLRRIQGFDQDGPLVTGDRVLVLYNNRRLGRMNGEVCIVDEVVPFMESTAMQAGQAYGLVPTAFEKGGLHVKLDTGTRAFIHPELIGQPFSEFKDAMRKLRITTKHHWLHVDYGQAITVHKSQGSEWGTVAFVIDRTTRFLARKDPNQARHLVYTGVTRAKERLVVFDVD